MGQKEYLIRVRVFSISIVIGKKRLMFLSFPRLHLVLQLFLIQFILSVPGLAQQTLEVELTPQYGFLNQYPVGKFYNLRDVQLGESSIRLNDYEAFYLTPSLAVSGSFSIQKWLKIGVGFKHMRKDSFYNFDRGGITDVQVKYHTRMSNWQTGIFTRFELPSTDTEKFYLKLGYTLNRLSWPQIFSSTNAGCAFCEPYSALQKNRRTDWSSGLQLGAGFQWTIADHYLIGVGFNYDYITFSPSTIEVVEFSENGTSQLDDFSEAQKNFKMTNESGKLGEIGENYTYLQKEEYRFVYYAISFSLGYRF